MRRSMLAGEPFAREIRSRDTPEELQHRLVGQLSTLLAPAKYKLAAHDGECVEYRRQYLPAGLLAIAPAALALAGVLVASGRAGLLVAATCAALGLSLLTVRRSDVLVVRVERRPGGSVAVVSGHLNGRGRMALLGLDPLSKPRFQDERGQLRAVESVADSMSPR